MNGPIVVVGIGGSGTRVAAQMLDALGVHMGTPEERNPEWDTHAYIPWWHRHAERLAWGWRYGFVPYDNVAHTGIYECDQKHRPPDEARQWGWKVAGNIEVVPFLAAFYSDLRLVHVMRDGRDLLASKSKVALLRHARAVVGPVEGETRLLARYWATVNIETAAIGIGMGSRYLRVRLEDLVKRPGFTIYWLAHLVGLRGMEDEQAVRTHSIPQDPGTIGRWKDLPSYYIEAFETEGAEALMRFGYEPTPDPEGLLTPPEQAAQAAVADVSR